MVSCLLSFFSGSRSSGCVTHSWTKNVWVLPCFCVPVEGHRPKQSTDVRKEILLIVDAPNMFDWFHKYWTCVAFGQSLSPSGHRESEGGACLHLVHQVLQLFHPMCMTSEKVRILRGWALERTPVVFKQGFPGQHPKQTWFIIKSYYVILIESWKMLKAMKDVESYESSVSLLALLAMSM